jgi:hypothetical protein
MKEKQDGGGIEEGYVFDEREPGQRVELFDDRELERGRFVRNY